MKIVADSKIPYLRGLLEKAGHEVCYIPGSETTPGDVHDARVLLTRTRTRCDGSLLEGSRVEMIGTATIGMDHIDLDYCLAHGIHVVNAPGCNAPAVAQWVHASILQWLKARQVTHPITLGIVGVGHVGSIVARWAQQLGYRVLLNDPPRAEHIINCENLKETRGSIPNGSSPSKIEGAGGSMTTIFYPLSRLQQECDIITFHTPLTRGGSHPTWHLCDQQFLQGLKRCRLIINAARGAVCDNQALLNWSGDLALDCWENEPAISLPLLKKAFIATPHIAGYSLQGKQRGTSMIIDALNQRYGCNIEPQRASTPLEGAAHVTPQAISSSYDPLADTLHLKAAPQNFEYLRNNYPLRQELP